MMTEERGYPIRDAFRGFYNSFLEAHPGLDAEKRKAAECIMKCKTGELGYNISICEKCGNQVIHAVSCNNRSCPNCQAALERKWEAERDKLKAERQQLSRRCDRLKNEAKEVEQIRRNV